MNLAELYDYKNQMMEDILTVDKIVNLLSDTDENGNPIYTLENARELRYKQVFPCEYIPTTVHDGATFICFDVDVTSSANKTYLFPVLHVWIFSHRSRMFLPDGGGVRPDIIAAEVCKKINGSREYGLGELNFYSAKRFAPMTDYNGKVLTFHAVDFNRQYNPNKYTPSNRKE